MFLRAANFAAKKITAGGRLRPESKLFLTDFPHARFCTANVAVTGADEVTKMPTTPTTFQYRSKFWFTHVLGEKGDKFPFTFLEEFFVTDVSEKTAIFILNLTGVRKSKTSRGAGKFSACLLRR